MKVILTWKKTKTFFGLSIILNIFTKKWGSTVRKNCSSDREKLLKFEAEGSLEQFIQTFKGQNNF